MQYIVSCLFVKNQIYFLYVMLLSWWPSWYYWTNVGSKSLPSEMYANIQGLVKPIFFINDNVLIFVCLNRKDCFIFFFSASLLVPWAWNVMWKPTSLWSLTPQSNISWKCGAVLVIPSSSSFLEFPPLAKITSGTGRTFASLSSSVSFGEH